MKKILNTFAILFFAFFLFSPEASAQDKVTWGWPGGEARLKGSPITDEVSGVVGDATSASRTISYGIGGLGAVALGALAFFGRFQWGWFFGLIGGLALIGLYNVAVQNLAGGNVTDLNTSN
jgi:hypothetical protein